MKNPFNSTGLVYKLILKGKYLLIIQFVLSMSSLPVSLSAGEFLYAQNKKMKIKAYDKTIKEIFSLIEKSSSFLFIYSENLSGLNKKVSIHAENESIEKILDKLFKNTNLTYEIDDKQIIINERKKKNIPISTKTQVKLKG